MGDTQIVNLKNQIKCLKERLGKKTDELEAAKSLIKNLKCETENLRSSVNSSGAGFGGKVNLRPCSSSWFLNLSSVGLFITCPCPPNPAQEIRLATC